MRYILLFLTCFISNLGSAQQGFTLLTEAPKSYTISGTVVDTFNNSATIYTSVSLIRASDSILQSFTRADENGHFKLSSSQKGAYIILFAHPSFAQYTDLVQLDSDINLGEVPLISKRNVLADVIIRDKQKIIIKGDTVEFNADSFQTRQYANVDELLKKLPGIEVGSDGSIKAYGEKVQKMLVDGEEFFSDDPAVVSKTLRASTIDKVQVFDKKSEQAEFTGIDDGEKVKTINLKLKNEAKQGYFGKVALGGGLPEHWENQAMINSFSKKRKISAYGIMSNTSKSGLGWDEQRDFGGGGNVSFSNSGSVTTITRTAGDGPNFNGQGIPKSWTAGVHYGNKFFKDKLNLNGGYKYNGNALEAINNNITQFVLPDTQYINERDGRKTSNMQRHNLNLTAKYDLDSMSTIRVSLDANTSTGFQNTSTTSSSRNFNGNLINDELNLQYQNTDNQGVNTSVFYSKRFKKKGRSMSLNLSEGWSEAKSTGKLTSKYNLYAVDSAYDINQNKENENNSLRLSAKASYTEPLSEHIFLSLNYGISSNDNQSVNNSFDQGGTNEHGVLNPLYSNSYQYSSLDNRGGASIIMNFKKINFTFGGDVANTKFTQIDRTIDSTFSYSNLNFFPQLSLRFKKSRSSNFHLRYSGRTQQPSINQLQPLRQNENPLDISIGNPDLKQEFSHNFNVNFFNFKALSGTYTMIGVNMSVVQNAISQKQTIDFTGRRTYQYVNIDGNWNTNAYAMYSFRKIGNIKPSINLNGNYGKVNGFINGIANVNTNSSIGPSFSLSYDQDSTFSIYYTFDPNYNNTSSSIRPDVITDYWTFNQNFDGSIRLPLQFEAGTGIEWSIRQKIDQLEKNNNVFLWNAFISKSFLKDRSLVAKIYANDILNQNSGYRRFNSPNQISETSYNTIKRYFLFSITWNFTKTAAQKENTGFNFSE